MDPRTIDLRKINSMTKYPSIPTYHDLDPKNGMLLDTHIEFPTDESIHLFEKIDGVNTRIIVFPKPSWMKVLPHPFIVGSREDLLWYSGDLIPNSAHGIVAAVRETAEQVAKQDHDCLVVYYLETFGGSKLTRGSKNYTKTGKFSFRLFDVMAIPVEEVEEMLGWDITKFSGWRERGGQKFFDLYGLELQAKRVGLDIAPLAVEIKVEELDSLTLPEDHEGMLAFLNQLLPETHVALDEEAHKKAEGFVARTYEREIIAKIKFRDYESTLRRKNQPQKKGRKDGRGH